jgi:hypothetical protein
MAATAIRERALRQQGLPKHQPKAIPGMELIEPPSGISALGVS